MRNSYKDFLCGGTTLLVELLEEFFDQRPIRSLIDIRESNLEIAMELIWLEEMQCVPQLHLVVDVKKEHRDRKHGFVDLFVGNSQRQPNASNRVPIIELKNVSLLSLWKAKQRNPSAKPKSQKEYEPLLKQVHKATEYELLGMQFTFYNENTRNYVTRQVQELLEEAIIQLNRYLDTLSRGQGGPNSVGVQDTRVLCQNGGQDVLWGYIIICVGGTRIILRQEGKIQTQCTYELIRLKSKATKPFV
jgi:hypothetical protein